MSEDDCIQYLGTRPSTRALPSPPFLSSSQRPVTGVSLYIEKSATEASYGMLFRKAEEPVVHIGRRPGSDGDKRKSEPGKAFFSCPVVSRNHAKIVFSDSGHAYIIDLHSHHGTHIRKKDEAVSKQLNPEGTPQLLADGDVVTFGKSVGSDKGLVRPVVARVDLLYGSQPPLKPLVVPGAPEGQQKSLLRTPSGRYGVYVSASSEGSSSSDERASPDSHDSDIEEISGLSPVAVRPPWHDNSSGSGDSASSPQVTRKQSPERFSAPRNYSPFAFSDDYRAFSPGPPEPLFDRDSAFHNVGFDAYSNDIFEDDDNDDNSDNSSYSSRRSNSPMDLSSSREPSEPPTGAVKESQLAVGEPVIVGAWPRSRSSSPVSVFSSSLPVIRLGLASRPAEEAAPVKPAANDPAKVVDSVENDSDVEAITVDKDDTEKALDSTETVQLKASLATVKAEVAKLHAHRRKYKQRFNDNIQVMGDKFSNLEERTTEAHDLYNLLSDRLEENVEACYQAQVQLDALQVRMDETPDKPIEPETPPYVEEAKVRAKVLEELVTEMTTLRDTARKEMADELQSIREAKEALKSLTEQIQVQTASLKRKRIDEDVEAEIVPKATVETVAEMIAPPPRKRVKRVAKVLAQTATAVSIGAVVTWSALAFS
ncbi:hypothetical protein MVEN_01019600 [Mycena venus]|uniref:FHA domain-containing protein n=1 Tax=Mycena venus TaxID=2733690 RepID=A0A8H6YF28_9AGAR|nr:hypothetical protein MVEN_01019600 [Mycena venus]